MDLITFIEIFFLIEICVCVSIGEEKPADRSQNYVRRMPVDLSMDSNRDFVCFEMENDRIHGLRLLCTPDFDCSG